MGEGITTNLARELGAVPPASVGRLAEGDQERLLEYFRAALEHQRQALRDAREEGLSHIPALLRGPVRRILKI